MATILYRKAKTDSEAGWFPDLVSSIMNRTPLLEELVKRRKEITDAMKIGPPPRGTTTSNYSGKISQRLIEYVFLLESYKVLTSMQETRRLFVELTP